MEIQAWGLRRMISVFNLVTRRPHIPRELAVRRILISQGFQIPLEMPRPGPVPGSKECLEEGDDGQVGEEGEEEEEFEEDEMVEDEMLEDVAMEDVPVGHLPFQ